MTIVYIAAGLIVFMLVLGLSLARGAAMADLHAMRTYAAKPHKATDPWEEPRVTGGLYDVEQDEWV